MFTWSSVNNANSLYQKDSPKERVAFLTGPILPVSPFVLYAKSLFIKLSPPDIVVKYAEVLSKKMAPSKDAAKIDLKVKGKIND